MKLIFDKKGEYNSAMVTWCVWLLMIGKYAIGLQCNHKKWMRIHVEFFTKDVCQVKRIMRIDIGY